MVVNRRRTEIDGLRGLAILMVVGYHYFARWPGIVPYGDSYAYFPLFKFGNLGVELFFMISGYVIFMTLNATADIKQFLWKRWTRLFPAMAVASALIFLSAVYLPDRPGSAPKVADLLPGLFFIEEHWINKFFGINARSLEGAFWTLYVEVRFYIMVSVLYFYVGKKYMVPSLTALAVVSALLYVVMQSMPDAPPIVTSLYSWMGYNLEGKYIGWFVIGMVAYERTTGHAGSWNWALMLLASVSALVQRSDSFVLVLLCSAIIGLFLLVACYRKLTGFFGCVPFAFFGAISYPLYLLNEKTGIALIVGLGRHAVLPSFALPFFALAIICIPAFVIAKYVEPAAQHMLKRKPHLAQSLAS
jgi:peptidoglycan/LPS O-acetylase OafA/YrhL